MGMERDNDTAAGLRPGRRAGPVEPCPVCDGEPRVLVAIRHSAMRRFTRELLARDHGCWDAAAIGLGEALGPALARCHPDLLVVDAADFPACCPALGRFPPGRVIVVGREPDRSYRAVALSAGAGGWVPRERIAEDLGPAMRGALGCHHAPCPPGAGRARVGQSPGVASAAG